MLQPLKFTNSHETSFAENSVKWFPNFCNSTYSMIELIQLFFLKASRDLDLFLEDNKSERSFFLNSRENTTRNNRTIEYTSSLFFHGMKILTLWCKIFQFTKILCCKGEIYYVWSIENGSLTFLSANHVTIYLNAYYFPI